MGRAGKGGTGTWVNPSPCLFKEQTLRARDNQRSKVYKAEQVIHDRFELENIEAVEKYVKIVSNSKYFQKHFGVFSFHIKDGRGTRKAFSSGNVLNFPVWSRKKAIVLHEIAHSIVNKKYLSAASHGPEFCKIYLILVNHFLGKECYKELKQSFRLNKVKCSIRKKKTGLSNKPKKPMPVAAIEALKKYRESKKRETNENQQMV